MTWYEVQTPLGDTSKIKTNPLFRLLPGRTIFDPVNFGTIGIDTAELRAEMDKPDGIILLPKGTGRKGVHAAIDEIARARSAAAENIRAMNQAAVEVPVRTEADNDNYSPLYQLLPYKKPAPIGFTFTPDTGKVGNDSPHPNAKYRAGYFWRKWCAPKEYDDYGITTA
jgi:hypothetical protein